MSIFPFPFNNENSPYSDSVIDQPFSCTDCPPSLFRDDSSYSTIVSEGDVTLPNGDIYTNVTLVENIRTFTDRQTGSSPCITTLVVRQLFAEGLVIPVMETLSFTNTGSCAPNPYGYTKFLDSIAESGSCPNPSITQWNMGSDSVSFDGTNNSSISSYEVEQAFLEIPNITEAAAYAIPAKGGEGMEDEVMVALMRNDNTSIDYNDLLNQAKKNLATFAIPKYIRIMKDFPKTQTGKIKKNKLREDGVTVDAWQNKNI